MAQASTKIDWTTPVRTSHAKPLVGRVGEACPLSGKRRVGLPSLSAYDPTKIVTWYHYDERGCCSVVGSPSEYDLTNFDPRDGVEVTHLHGDAK